MFRRKYITFAVPIENEVRRIDQNGEKNTKNISYILQLIKSAKLKQVLCQILLIIYLKDFIELNVNEDIMIKNIKYLDDNIGIATVFLNTQSSEIV